MLNYKVSEHLLNVGVDFQGLDILADDFRPSAAHYYLRILTWLEKYVNTENMVEFPFEALASSYHAMKGCRLRAEFSKSEKEQSLWVKIEKSYGKIVKEVWAKLWQVIQKYIYEDETSEEIMERILNDTSRDIEINAYCEPRIRFTERLAELPSFDLELPTFELSELETPNGEDL